jgi:hypothetical protein
MVDGEHHFPGSAGQHYSTSYQVQKDVDDRFNDAVLAGEGEGYIIGILRLHWRHVSDSAVWIAHAIHYAQACRQQCFRFVMLSWGNQPKIKQVDVRQHT